MNLWEGTFGSIPDYFGAMDTSLPRHGVGVTLVAVSETGTQFCAVVTDTEVQRGTTTNDLSTVENADGTAVNATVPGPITCDPEGW